MSHINTLDGTGWDSVLGREFDRSYWHALQVFVDQERSCFRVYPSNKDVFTAFHLTSYANTKVVILGQDPYHGEGQSHGLCFSVRRGVRKPPSLENIHRELHSDLGLLTPEHGNLERWARQGVLLLNTTLTVRARVPRSHRGRGWERFTDAVIRAVNKKHDRVVFILWGQDARGKRKLIDNPRHIVLESSHPSPLAAHKCFFGSRPFSRANCALTAAGREAIDWRLTE